MRDPGEWDRDRETCERATDAIEQAAAVNQERWLKACANFAFLAKDRWPAALSRIAALEAERDAAFKRGWEAAKARAVEAVEQVRVWNPSDVPDQALVRCKKAIAAIRAIEPDTSGTVMPPGEGK